MDDRTLHECEGTDGNLRRITRIHNNYHHFVFQLPGKRLHCLESRFHFVEGIAQFMVVNQKLVLLLHTSQ